MQLSFPIKFNANVTLCNKLSKRVCSSIVLYGFDHIYTSQLCSENYKNQILLKNEIPKIN